MMKQIPTKNGQQQNNVQKQTTVPTQNKQGLKQFKSGNQQQQQGFAKQQALKYFNKSTFCNIVLFLKANEIMEFRLVNRLFNKLFIDCAPVLLENLEKKEDDYFQKQHNNPQKLELPKLLQVDLKELKQNLENRGMYACVDKLHGDNLFSVELVFDMITQELPPWRKAKFTFPLKVKTILEKYDFNIYNLNDQQIQLINQKKNYNMVEFVLYNEDFHNLIQYVKNLKMVAAFQDYKYFCDWYEIEKENTEMQNLIGVLRAKSLQQQK